MTVTSDVVAAHAGAVWRTAFRLLNNREDALDCYQQTFLDAMSLDRVVRSWHSALCCIATRRAMDQLRRRYREQQVITRSDIELTTDAPP